MVSFHISLFLLHYIDTMALFIDNKRSTVVNHVFVTYLYLCSTISYIIVSVTIIKIILDVIKKS